MAWNRALHGGRILSPAAYRELVTPGTLNDGTRIRYAKGLVVDSLAGRPVLRHGGGINGFLTDLAYFPEDSLTIAVLINTAGPVSPARITQAIAELLYGRVETKAQPFRGRPAEYAGEYRGVGRGRELVVVVAPDSAGRGLTVRAGEGRPVPLLYLGGETFAIDVRQAREVVGFEDATPVPLAPPHVLGVANLRGEVVTIVDAREPPAARPVIRQDPAHRAILPPQARRRRAERPRGGAAGRNRSPARFGAARPPPMRGARLPQVENTDALAR